MKINLPVGRSGFADIRKNGYYYIDKSGLIRELLRTDAVQVTLITRPRRFGKTLGMSMLSEFFDMNKSSRELFEGLSILSDPQICDRWMNQYPTVCLSFQSVDGMNFEEAYDMLRAEIARACKSHLYLLESTTINAFDKDIFARVAGKQASKEEVKNALTGLTQMLSAHFHKPAVLLIDEYDVPLAKAAEKGYYDRMLDVMKGVLHVIKDNSSLKFAVISGCLRIAKESIFTGTNNLVSDTISDTRLNAYFGFTQAETDQILRDSGLQDHAAEIRTWYDGYRFGDFEIYCPWDVLNHVKNLQLNPQAQPQSYWKNSSDNAIIRSFMEDYSGTAVTKKFEALLAGESVIQKIEDDLTYDSLHVCEDHLWSVLYLTGYLTRVRKNTLQQSLPAGCMELTIPNEEIREIFEGSVRKWFQDSMQNCDRKALFAAVWNGDEQKAAEELTKLLRRTISYHDYREDFYHAFFAGIFAGAGYLVESNHEHGEGRSDILIQDDAGDRVAVFEVKYSKTLAALEGDCVKALAQIDSRMYAEEWKEEYAQVICYGIAFYKKRCLLKKK